MTPVLIGCSHGTASAQDRAAIRALLDQARVLLPHVEVREGFVDRQKPSLDHVIADVAPGVPVVVAPLLLSTDHHTKIDIEDAVRRRPTAISTPALGPHDLLALVLESRLDELGLRDDDGVVLAAADSRDPATARAVSSMAERLSICIRRPVGVGFATGRAPRLAEAVSTARMARAGRVVAASYVLAPGHFADLVRDAGADAVTQPLAPDPRVAAIIAERFHDAVATLAA
ncbi:sirohydrochlorin chelatase [Microbacterium protaetiae]|uniref:Sirohydrochlorin chelatase n=1 Tax=Microbacterium protaetiae TaxID=2509458 RepID=A0A4P6EFT0_9MICO|nr:CbiX/SirB N-terminal domain-containing protein [Microbacterium protaetiae]QAY61144.1 sirohydrochlorin chelatase [Microbacterium protaetiae]